MTCTLNADATKAPLDLTALSEANISALRRSRILLWALSMAALGIASVYAYYFVFSRPMSMDEGYLMITVEAFNQGNALYDVVFTQYGPFYYFYEWFARTVLSVPLTHDATRFMCIAHWFAAAFLLSITAWRMTRSTWAALFVGLQAVVHLSSITREPGHPQELVVMLLAAGALVATRCSRTSGAIEGLVVISALLVFTKINVGAFFGFAVLLAMRCHASDRFARGFWNLLPLAISAGAPFVLMRSHLATEWSRNYAIMAACTTLVTFWVARRAAAPNVLRKGKLFSQTATFLAAVVALLGITFLTGTSWKSLVEGLILTPMKLPNIAVLPIGLSNAVVLNAAVALGFGILVICRQLSRANSPLIAGLKFVFAVVGAFCLVGNVKEQFAYLLPWVWLVMVTGDDETKLNERESFPRVFLALASAWQSLQAYPIAGTQLTLATVLLVLAFGVCLSDALAFIARTDLVRRSVAGLANETRTLLQALGSVALLFLFANAWCKLPTLRGEYARLHPLDLPGSRHVHTDEQGAEFYRTLTQYLTAESDTFITYPGLNSLYFWTGKRPPTNLNSTGWGQFTHAQQEQILGALQRGSRPKIVVAEPLMKNWRSPSTEVIRPLTRYVLENCRPIQRIGQYIVFEPNIVGSFN